jgi:hypothetical protein
MANYYGIGSSDIVLTYVYIELLALKALMLSEGHSPTFNYLYSYHQVALLRLNAVTIAIDDGNTEPIGNATVSGISTAVYYYFDVSIRVHTEYEGDQIDTLKNERLLNSIDSYMHTHVQNESANYEIIEMLSFNPSITFDDSRTVGGEIKYRLRKEIDHTQA